MSCLLLKYGMFLFEDSLKQKTLVSLIKKKIFHNTVNKKVIYSSVTTNAYIYSQGYQQMFHEPQDDFLLKSRRKSLLDGNCIQDFLTFGVKLIPVVKHSQHTKGYYSVLQIWVVVDETNAQNISWNPTNSARSLFKISWSQLCLNKDYYNSHIN